MNLDQLLGLQPKLHVDEQGKPASWAIGQDALGYLDAVVKDGWRTMETGSGLSTLLFALKGCHHTAISPAQSEHDAIRELCLNQGIDTERLRLICEHSEIALPRLRLETEDLDLFLVDGRHAFPTPYIDWFYGASMLRVGGLMVVDDTQILTGAVLRDFLSEDTHWRTRALLDKTAVFEKCDQRFHIDEWNNQPYIRNRMNVAP